MIIVCNFWYFTVNSLYSHRYQWSNNIFLNSSTTINIHIYTHTWNFGLTYLLTFAMYCIWIPNTKFKPTLEDFSVAGDGLGRSKKNQINLQVKCTAFFNKATSKKAGLFKKSHHFSQISSVFQFAIWDCEQNNSDKHWKSIFK